MNVLTTDVSAQQRVEARRDLRNLDNFLNFDFNAKDKLSILQIDVQGHVVTSLSKIAKEKICWRNSLSLCWHKNLDLKKISHYIAEKVPVWSQLLQGDSLKFVALERQCALFERLVTKYNQKNEVTRKSSETPFSFVNPLKKRVSVLSIYPAIIGQSVERKVLEEIVYDRLMTAAELAKRVKVAIEKPVLIQVAGKLSLQSDREAIRSFSVSPQALFRTVVQQPNNLFDPSDDVLRENNQTISFVYQDPDTSVLSTLLFDAGKEQSSPQVYQEGFNAGRISGYQEALQKVREAFAGK